MEGNLEIRNLGGIDICGGTNRNFGSECKELRNQEISKVKVKWSHHSPREATWEVEESMREKYPYLFHEPDYYEAPSVPQVSDEPTLAGHIEGNYPQWGDEQRIDWAQRMVFYAVGPSYFVFPHEGVPNDGTRFCPMDANTSSYVYDGDGPYDYDESGLAARFFNVVHVANQPLWDGCNQPQLDVVDVLVDIKADGHISERIYNRISQWANKILPSDHTLLGDYYSTKKLVKDLVYPLRRFMHVRMVSCCTGRTMSIWSTANSMGTVGTSLLEGETHTERSPSMQSLEEPHNVRLGLYTDGFTPHGQYNRTYSCWSVIITPYNISPGMCISSEYMFLTMVILGPSDPKRLIDVYLESLIEELLQMWHMGVRTYDHATDQVVMMRAASIWNVNDLPAYRMASGKACYFDCHKQFLPAHHPSRSNKKAFMKNHVENKVARPRLTGDQILDQVANINPAIEMSLLLPDSYGSDHSRQKNIFWDLPYWSTLLIRHNFDFMHIEKNVFDNIFNTVMDIKGKMKVNMNARPDVKIICNRPKLELDERRPNDA
ncbi:hypothetical protein Sango_3087500 [Sesamum angolense]|uniref:Uncharacterized protein n=1 Tax=Sesamum angolense TaxID=2727404 RepID=A0AAE1TAS9_9LAMI|nr:hypothetical protein Sango_3087500 [Sesamum angolense]